MGTFSVTLEIGNASGERNSEVSALVDTGAAYTWVPGSILEGLGLEPSFRWPFELADGQVIERDLTETRVRMNGHDRTTIVIFGDEGTGSLLGAYTLESFGLQVDPVNRRLVPIERFPMAAGISRDNGWLTDLEESCGRK